MNKRHLFLALSLFCFSFWTWTSAQESSSPPVEEKQIEESPDLTAEFSLLQEEVKKLRLAEEEENAKAVTPVQIQIPKIDVDTAIEQVGVLENGQMGVPEDENQVGWFEPGVTPGSKGNAVIAGHVDSKTGPAVFYQLDQLKEGDDVLILDEAGNTLRFRVTKTERYDTKTAPIEEIFGATSNRNLNLITCSGTFGDGGYDERFVVYTELVDTELNETVDLEIPTAVERQGNLLTWHAVRQESVIGYRIYEVVDGKATHIESVPSHARKSIEVASKTGVSYYVTAIDQLGNESKPSQTTK